MMTKNSTAFVVVLPRNYTDEEAEEFANVLYTMQPQEAKGWNRSLILRGINVPNQVKDELIAVIEGK